MNSNNLGRRNLPQHLKNVRSVLAKTFHENARYNWQSSKGDYFFIIHNSHDIIHILEGDIDSGVDESTNSNDSGEKKV